MKALTICQPYAHLIVAGTKRVENRTWPTSYRGPLAIHAGKSRSWLSLSDDKVMDEEYEILVDDMVFGAVVAVAELVACISLDVVEIPNQLAWIRDHEHAQGPWCWVLDSVRAIEPVPYRGAQGLFEVPNELMLNVML